MPDYYNILKLNRTATKRQIQKRTYSLGRSVHPKKASPDLIDSNGFVEIVEAYSILSNESTREIYHWILDHDSGVKVLGEQAIAKHQRKLDIESYRGRGLGYSYLKEPFWVFKDDFGSSKWWSWWEIFSYFPT